jgi:hypothetical protein
MLDIWARRDRSQEMGILRSLKGFIAVHSVRSFVTLATPYKWPRIALRRATLSARPRIVSIVSGRPTTGHDGISFWPAVSMNGAHEQARHAHHHSDRASVNICTLGNSSRVPAGVATYRKPPFSPTASSWQRPPLA